MTKIFRRCTISVGLALLANYITSAIQGINGASLKEYWVAQRNQVYKQQYQRLQHDTSLKYKRFFLKLSQS